MLTLYAMESEWIKLDELLDESKGEITPKVEAQIALIDSLEWDVEKKLEGYARAIKNYEALSEMQKKESDRLSDASKASANKAEKLKDRVKGFIKLVYPEKASVPAGPFTLRVYTAGGIAPLAITGQVPNEYQIAKTTYSVDQVKIRAEIDAGKELGFAKLGERKEVLKIG